MAARLKKVESGERGTLQRQVLLQLLSQIRRHVTADELYQEARKRHSRLSLSTVYRNLELFKKMGLVEEHRLEGGRCHYEARAEARHHHLVCLGCGAVEEFQCPWSDEMAGGVGRQKGFRVVDAEVRLAGYCRRCQEQFSGRESQYKAANR